MNFTQLQSIYNNTLNTYIQYNEIDSLNDLIIICECLKVNMPASVYNNFVSYDGLTLKATGAYKSIFRLLDKLHNKANNKGE